MNVLLACSDLKRVVGIDPLASDAFILQLFQVIESPRLSIDAHKNQVMIQMVQHLLLEVNLVYLDDLVSDAIVAYVSHILAIAGHLLLDSKQAQSNIESNHLDARRLILLRRLLPGKVALGKPINPPLHNEVACMLAIGIDPSLGLEDHQEIGCELEPFKEFLLRRGTMGALYPE